jgi:nucleotide-binding universal stress UspA family protein
MSMKILLAVDGSECSLRAADSLLAYLAWLRDVPALHLLHVQPPVPIGRVQAHIGKETLHDYYREESQVQLTPVQARLDAAGCGYTTHIHVGQPAEVIARLASDLQSDLIVIGAHGRGALVSMVMGSVATRVLHLATCPVLLVK